MSNSKVVVLNENLAYTIRKHPTVKGAAQVIAYLTIGPDNAELKTIPAAKGEAEKKVDIFEFAQAYRSKVPAGPFDEVLTEIPGAGSIELSFKATALANTRSRQAPVIASWDEDEYGL